MLAFCCGILDVEHEVHDNCVVCCLHVVAEVLAPDHKELILVDQSCTCRRVSIAEVDCGELQSVSVILEVDNEACGAWVALDGDRNCHVRCALRCDLGADGPADLTRSSSCAGFGNIDPAVCLFDSQCIGISVLNVQNGELDVMLADRRVILHGEGQVQNDCAVCCLLVCALVIAPDNSCLACVDQSCGCRSVSIAEGDACQLQRCGIVVEGDHEAGSARIALDSDRNDHVGSALCCFLVADRPAVGAGISGGVAGGGGRRFGSNILSNDLQAIEDIRDLCAALFLRRHSDLAVHDHGFAVFVLDLCLDCGFVDDVGTLLIRNLDLKDSDRLAFLRLQSLGCDPDEGDVLLAE